MSGGSSNPDLSGDTEAKTGVHHFHGDNNELGTACGRYYRQTLGHSSETFNLFYITRAFKFGNGCLQSWACWFGKALLVFLYSNLGETA